MLVLLNGTSTFVLDLPSAMGDYAIRLDPLGALVLLIGSSADCQLEIWGLEAQAGVFRSVFGVQLTPVVVSSL